MKTPEHVAELNRTTAETAMKLAQVAIGNAEKLVQLQLDAVRHMLEDNLKSTRALTQAKDPQQFAALRARAVEEGLGQMVVYSRSVYDLAAKTQAEFGKLVEQRFTAFNRELTQMVDNAAAAAPAGSAPAIAAMKQTLAATNAMVETLAKTAKQFAEAADSNIKSVTAAPVNAARRG